ncbi:Mannose-1-phosphate guanylyltransferase (GDP) [Mucinivorans hirudinis]|uniref:Mannose-1-phosphate guanylyltransferase (GDP) n=1 Tax=Mucinivorans hirudinis TaxID=1433126 RepID=A0A060RBX7_9BACT|nr:Mannose-1-phosphate guanylyltransferase (GDP) [Mucinivorans hirudinis]
MPKQFLDILGVGKSFIRSTFERFLPIIPPENFLVVTSESYKGLTLEHLPELNESQILCEPLRRNTAPCIAYATYHIKAKCPDANIVVTPSDHLITNEAEFQRIISDGLSFVAGDSSLLTIGIKPSRPETGYGYIQIDTTGKVGDTDKVKTFTEKPNIELAKMLVNSGEFVWNSGIFLWSVKGIVDAFERYLPEIKNRFDEGAQYFATDKESEFINELYPGCPSISIDYGVMEKADNVYVRQADFGWSDVGTWGSLYAYSHKDELGNAVTHNNAILHNCKGNIVNLPQGKVAVVEGLDGYLVVDTDSSLLICKIENEQSIRNYVEDVKYRFGEEYL